MQAIKIHIGENEILRLSDIWHKLQYHPNNDFDHFLLVCRIRQEVIAPVAFSYWKDGNCQAIIAARIENSLIKPKIGYFRFLGIRTKSLNIIHEGIIGNLDEEGAEALFLSILNLMKEKNLDLVSFNNLSERFAMIWNHLRNKKFTFEAKKLRWTIHRALTLQKKPGFLLERMRSKHRSWIKRKQKELEFVYPGSIQWKWVSEFEDIKPICEKMEMVARKTYQRGLRVGFIDDDETRQRLELFQKKGQLRIMLLEGDGKPLSFWYGIVYKNVFFASATGYLPEVEKYEVGTLTLLRTIDNLVREGVEKIDFGLGDAYYKERFSDISWREATVNLFSNNMKSRFIKNFIMLTDFSDQCLQNFISKIGVEKKVKKFWRKKIRPK